MFADLQLIQIIFLFLFPLYVLYLEKSGYKITSWLSPVLLCYLAGIISANIPFLKIDNSVSSRVSELAILIAIPMLLFSTDLLKWLRLAPKTVLAYIFVIFSVMTSSVIFGLMARDYFEDSWKLSGMLVGVYTGGTPNMSAIGIALDVEESLFVLVNAADVMLGGIYLVFLLTIAKKLLRNIMPDFKKNKNITGFIPQEKSGDHKKRCMIIYYLFSIAFALYLYVLVWFIC